MNNTSAFDFDTMIVGHEFEFYGVDCCQFKLGIDGFTFVLEAMEDKSDGYRSYLDCIQISESNSIFFPTYVAYVRVEIAKGAHRHSEFGGEWSGYRLIDIETGHVWVEFGTDYSGGYYPSFFFDYEPRKDQLVKLDTSE